MVQLDGRYEVRNAPFGEVHERCVRRVVLECGCRARLTLVGRISDRHPLECGVCGERFVLIRTL